MQAAQPPASATEPRPVLTEFLTGIAIAAGKAAVIAACQETIERLNLQAKKPSRRTR